VAYRADIEIAVRGATQITNLQQQINTLAKGVSVLNKTLRSGTIASIDNFNKAVSQSDRVMRSAAQGTRVQKQAIDTYVRSTIAAEKAEKSLQVAIQRRRKELGLAAVPPTGGGSRGGTGGRLGGAISGAVIGGSFPLLFGQGTGAAAGGAIGGLAGGLLGPGGSFAGSLLGTLIGDIASKGKQIKELGTDIGFSAEQTKELQSAFKLAGQEAEKFNDAVQNIRGLSLSIEEQANAIRLVSQLTETYGGRIDKTTNAFTNALESGKVTQATLNQLTSQGIPIQDELAKKYGVSRDAILAMAKDGQVSVQTLADVLVDMGNKGIQAGEKPKTAFEQFTVALGNTVTAVTNVANALLTVLAPAIDAIIQKATLALNALTETINTELLRSQIQGQTGKVISPAVMQRIEKDAMDMAARRYPSEAKGRQLAAGSGIISPRAQQEFQILREQGIRNELQRFGYEQGILKAPRSAVSTEIGRINAPSQLPPSGRSSGGAKTKTDRAAEEQQRLDALLKQLREEIKIRTESIGLEKSLLDARADQNDELEAQIQSSIRLLDIGSKQAVVQKNFDAGRIGRAEYTLRLQLLELDRTEDQIKYEEDLNRIFKERYGITEAIARLARETRTAAFGGTGATGTFRTDMNLMPGLTGGVLGEEYSEVKTQLEELLTVENQVASAADSIGQAFGNSFKGILDGTLSAQEALAGFFSSVADAFADMAAQMIAQWIRMQIIGLAQSLLPGGSTVFPQGVGNFSGAFGAGSSVAFNPAAAFGGFRAAGGSVTSGSSYVVGEKGPELFLPGRSGTIVPNSSMGGNTSNIVVNVDASGSRVEGDEQEGKQLGRVIAAAIQQELVKQKRPGGLLA
jgi:tape measure domain-containing protein